MDGDGLAGCAPVLLGLPMEYHEKPMKMTAPTDRSGERNLRLLVSLAAAVLFSLLPFFNGVCHPASRNAGCLPGFPDRDGWYGGDGAYSILLDGGRTLWLFGDTFVSDREARQDRVDMDLVLGTTLAISTCNREGQFSIRYFLKKKEGRFISAFGDPQWLWPQDPFKVHDRLYIPFAVIEPAPEIEGPFKFRVAGHKIAVIRNYRSREPDRWSVEYLDWSAAVPPGVAALAATSIVQDNKVYFYPFCVPSEAAPGVLGNLLVRIPVDRLRDPAGAMEYYAKDDRWRKGFDPAKAKIVLDAGVSELSVRYHESRKQWIAVYLSVHNGGDRLLYRSAQRSEGPWSEPKVLIPAIPEVNPADPKYHQNNFCYAGKEHIQFARKGRLVTTYVCNSLENKDRKADFIRNHLFLYRPVVNEVPY
jgi:hypothetical protein